MLPALLVAAPSLWLAVSLAVAMQYAIAAGLPAAPGLAAALAAHALPLMAAGLGAAFLGNLLLGIELMQGRRTFTLFLSSLLVFLGAALWLSGLWLHPEWLWGQGHWLGIPLAAVLVAGPCGTAAVIRMLHTETILETFLVLLLFVAVAAVAHWLVFVVA